MWDDKSPLTGEEIAKIRQLLSHFSLPSAIIRLEAPVSPPIFPKPAYLLAALGWLITFGILLAAVFGMVLVDGVTISGFLFSLVIALAASATTKKPGGA